MASMMNIKEAMTKHVPEQWKALADDYVVSAAWSPRCNWLVAASVSGSILVLNAVSGSVARSFRGHSFGATTVQWHPMEEQFATAGQDGKIRLWSPTSDAALSELAGGAEWVEHLAWSPSGAYLLSAAGHKLRLWDANGHLVREYPDHSNTIAGVSWNPRAHEFASACYGQVHVWSPEAVEPLRKFFWKGSMVSLAWGPNGRYLCHGNQDSTVHFWILQTGQDLQMWGYPCKIRELSWDSHSRYLATGGGPQVTVWNCSGKGPANTKPIVLKQHRLPVSQLAYQHHGALLASGCQAGGIAIWNPSKHTKPMRVSRLARPVSHLSWSPDDEYLAAASDDGAIVMLRPGV